MNDKGCGRKQSRPHLRTYRLIMIIIRYREHIQTIRYHGTNSVYVENISKTGHSYGSLEDSLEIIHKKIKGIK
jgi:hypothetical protein